MDRVIVLYAEINFLIKLNQESNERKNETKAPKTSKIAQRIQITTTVAIKPTLKMAINGGPLNAHDFCCFAFMSHSSFVIESFSLSLPLSVLHALCARDTHVRRSRRCIYLRAKHRKTCGNSNMLIACIAAAAAVAAARCAINDDTICLLPLIRLWIVSTHARTFRHTRSKCPIFMWNVFIIFISFSNMKWRARVLWLLLSTPSRARTNSKSKHHEWCTLASAVPHVGEQQIKRISEEMSHLDGNSIECKHNKWWFRHSSIFACNEWRSEDDCERHCVIEVEVKHRRVDDSSKLSQVVDSTLMLIKTTPRRSAA